METPETTPTRADAVYDPKTGHWIIPSVQRRNGTWTKERRVKPGYVPAEEVDRYVPPAARRERQKPAIPGLTPVEKPLIPGLTPVGGKSDIPGLTYISNKTSPTLVPKKKGRRKNKLIGNASEGNAHNATENGKYVAAAEGTVSLAERLKQLTMGSAGNKETTENPACRPKQLAPEPTGNSEEGETDTPASRQKEPTTEPTGNSKKKGENKNLASRPKRLITEPTRSTKESKSEIPAAKMIVQEQSVSLADRLKQLTMK